MAFFLLFSTCFLAAMECDRVHWTLEQPCPKIPVVSLWKEVAQQGFFLPVGGGVEILFLALFSAQYFLSTPFIIIIYTSALRLFSAHIEKWAGSFQNQISKLRVNKLSRARSHKTMGPPRSDFSPPLFPITHSSVSAHTKKCGPSLFSFYFIVDFHWSYKPPSRFLRSHVLLCVTQTSQIPTQSLLLQ